MIRLTAFALVVSMLGCDTTDPPATRHTSLEPPNVRVVDGEFGAPIPNLRVTVTQSGAPGVVIFEGTTDHDGRSWLPFLEAGTADITVNGIGFQPTSGRVPGPGESTTFEVAWSVLCIDACSYPPSWTGPRNNESPDDHRFELLGIRKPPGS